MLREWNSRCASLTRTCRRQPLHRSMVTRFVAPLRSALCRSENDSRNDHKATPAERCDAKFCSTPKGASCCRTRQLTFACHWHCTW